jgi:glycosyltransferase involved in cell wall biosynthesis
MKILQVSHSFLPFNFAGVEVYTYNLCRELSKNHKVYIFYRINDLRFKDYRIFYGNLNGLEYYAINNTFRRYDSFESTYKNREIDERFSEILEIINPDIVHIQHLLYLSVSIIEKIKKKGIPIVFTLHDYWPICPQGQLLRDDYVICENDNYIKCIDCVFHQLSIKKNIFKHYYIVKSILPNFLFRFIMNNYFLIIKNLFLDDKKMIKKIKDRKNYIDEALSMIDIFISPSEFLRDIFIKFGISKEKIILNRFGFNLNDFKNSQKTFSKKIRFGFIGSILPAKGLHILIEAFNKIKDEQIELKIYGKFASYKGILRDYFKYIKKIIKNKNIKFMGGFDNRYIADIFNGIDVLVVPSIWPENSPLVIQEALATKTPVIASDTGGIPELVKNRVNGLLFKTGDSHALYAIIELVKNNPSILDELRKNIFPPKDIEINALEIENLYKKLLNNES